MHIKLHFYEKESDIKFSSLARRIFDSELPLDQKMHLRYFVEKLIVFVIKQKILQMRYKSTLLNAQFNFKWKLQY